MRFEAKHSYFKDMACKIKNFKNLPLSLAERHQGMESAAAIQINEGSDTDSCQMVDKDVQLGKGKVLLDHDKEYAVNMIKRFYEVSDNIHVLQYNSITVYGTCYKPGVNNFLLIGVDDVGLPKFGKLEKNLVCSLQWTFFCCHGYDNFFFL